MMLHRRLSFPGMIIGHGGRRVLAPAGAALLAGSTAPASAEVVRMIVDQRTTLPAETAKGIPAYEELRGRIVGEVDPAHAGNRIIQDIGRAPRNSRGKVEYVTTFTLLRPVAAGNGVLLTQIPNRGRRSQAYGAQGIPFLRARGYSVVWVGWQGDFPESPAADKPFAPTNEAIAVPRAKGITGPYLIRLPSASGQPPSGTTIVLEQGNGGALSYFPVSFDTRKARLTGGAPEDGEGKPTGPRYAIAAGDWSWWNCKADAAPETAKLPSDLCVKRLKGNFKPTESYNLVFVAKDPLVLGLGFAATRDAVSFLRYAAEDRSGTANPLAGKITHVVGQGQSQVGNFVKAFIALGFNADEQSRVVWDAANPHIAGRLVPMNFRFALPGGSATLYAPGSEGLLWWSRSTSPRGETGSMLDRCSATNTCPKIFETFGAAELWNQRISGGLVTPDLKRDIALPENVRRYFFPGTTHGGGDGGFKIVQEASARCSLPENPNPEDEQMRALLVALTDWAVNDRAPPPSRYPKLADGTLVRDVAGSLKPLPFAGAPSPYGIANPTLVYDFGKRFNYRDESGVITALPPKVIKVVPAAVPQIDEDGNDMGGVPSILARAPLGTYLGWNIYKAGPFAGRICSFAGSFVPFARTKAERLAAGDSRLSLEERYGTRRGYVGAVKKAVAAAVDEGFLLAEEGPGVVAAATAETESGDLSFLKP